MGIADVRKSFEAGLGGAAVCTSCFLSYVKGDNPGQRLCFTIHRKDGTTDEFVRVVPHGVNVVDHARVLGQEYASQIEGQ